MKEQFLVAQRIVLEGVLKGGILKEDITKKKLSDVKNPGGLLKQLKQKTRNVKLLGKNLEKKEREL